MDFKLDGVIPAMPTPLFEDEKVDINAVSRVAKYIIAEGASGIFVLGSMGEGLSLADDQKCILVESTLSAVNQKIPVLAGISDVSTKRTIDQGKMVRKLGVEYLVTTGPFFYSFPHPNSILEFMKTICGELGNGIVFYNCPLRTGNSVSFDTAETIMHMPEVVAWKDSSCDIHFVTEMLHRYPDRDNRPLSIFQGDESVFDISVLLGADGVITGGGTVFIDLLVRLYKTAKDGNIRDSIKLQSEFTEKMKKLLGKEPSVDWMYNIKKVLSEKGLLAPNVTSPFLKRSTD